jgi:hypothetical protein
MHTYISSQKNNNPTVRGNHAQLPQLASPGVSASTRDAKFARACDGAGWGLGGRRLENYPKSIQKQTTTKTIEGFLGFFFLKSMIF